MAGTPSQLQVLQAERARLADQLSADPHWTELHHLIQRDPSAPGSAAALAVERRRLEAALTGNAMYEAWRKLGEVIGLLENSSASKDADPLPAAAFELLRIKGMDEAAARALVAHGVTSLDQIAGWTANDVKALKKELKLGRRISQECWIEQAAILRHRAAEPAIPPSRKPPPHADTGVDGTIGSPRSTQSDSLTARLFARTPLTGESRSLLSAIEAAEQARLATSPLSIARQAAVPMPPAAAVPPRRESAAPDQGAGIKAQAQAPGAEPMPTELPVVSETMSELFEPQREIDGFGEEAEVVIVAKGARQRSGERQRAPASASSLFSIDVEQQGGEGYDPRAVAALRGTPQEASVEIIVKKRSK